MMRCIKIYRNSRKPNQIQYENSIGAMPIFIYHGVDYTGYDYSINLDLFEKELKYLFENGYKIFK